MNVIHVKNGAESLCKQTGLFLQLASAEEFQNLPPINRCHRCEKHLRLHRYGDGAPLSEKQRQLLVGISKTTGTAVGNDWWFAADLTSDKSDSGRTSLHRSLRRLQRRGYIEKKVNQHNRVLVRLTGHIYVTRPGKLFNPHTGKPIEVAPDREAGARTEVEIKNNERL